jgi:N-acetylmuramoyl-L-alanine amidase
LSYNIEFQRLIFRELFMRRKRFYFIWMGLGAIFVLFTSFNPVSHRGYGIKTVVIDAGHGGHDYGCLGSSAREKNIALQIALKFGGLIEKNFPDIKVIYTRKTDVFVELHERAGIANRAKADLFICIHCNSACVREGRKDICNEATHGPETYVMGLHKTEDNLAVARRENSTILLEKDYKTKYDGFDPNSPEANIIFTLFQNAFMNQSISLASKIQNEFEEYAGRSGRGVKQAGFLVLYRTTMPSVLVETGFLTNKSEEKYLSSENGQGDISNAIFRAFKEYKVDLESEQIPDAPQKSPQPEVSESTNKSSKDSLKDTAKQEQKELQKSNPDPLQTKKSNNDTIGAPVKKETVDTDIPVPAAKKEAKKAEKNNAEPVVFYTVQIGVSQNSSVNEKFEAVESVKKMISEDGAVRYTVGSFQNLNDAIAMQGTMRGKGFKDAFVTAYRDNKRITLKEAADLLKKN